MDHIHVIGVHEVINIGIIQWYFIAVIRDTLLIFVFLRTLEVP
jgi:hypothetical protein